MFGFLVSIAWAQDGGGAAAAPQLNPIVSFLPFILIFIVFYFLLIKPQQKKAKERREMVEALKKGDKVITSGGLIGTVTNLGPKIITIQIAEGVRVKVVRANIEELKDDDSDK
ncbi:MAG: preprotein translocase subunit YajC [Nitrospiria bacterium]